jgi:hypothetical protein
MKDAPCSCTVWRARAGHQPWRRSMARRQGTSGALALQDITEVLPDAWPNDEFRRAIKRLAP